MAPIIYLCLRKSTPGTAGVTEQRGRGLVILHIDGLGADSLEQALREGDMPFVKSLMETEGYEMHRYRCGIPSTTPFVQAGILYGDNSEIAVL